VYAIILSFIAIGSLLVWYFLRHDHGRQLPVESLWIAFGFGILGIIAAGFLEVILFPKTFWVSPQAVSLSGRFFFFLGVGALEETAKFLPLALFIYKKPYFKEHTDGVIYFAICGLTFGLFENILYTMSFGAKVGIARLVITPFLHAATTSILGFYLMSMKLDPAFRKKFVLACIVIPLMHGVYDFGLSSGILQLAVLSLMITLLLTLGLFLYFMEANVLDKAMPVSIASTAHNFCSSCGRPNTDHSIFCEYCGRRL